MGSPSSHPHTHELCGTDTLSAPLPARPSYRHKHRKEATLLLLLREAAVSKSAQCLAHFPAYTEAWQLMWASPRLPSTGATETSCEVSLGKVYPELPSGQRPCPALLSTASASCKCLHLSMAGSPSACQHPPSEPGLHCHESMSSVRHQDSRIRMKSYDCLHVKRSSTQQTACHSSVRASCRVLKTHGSMKAFQALPYWI